MVSMFDSVSWSVSRWIWNVDPIKDIEMYSAAVPLTVVAVYVLGVLWLGPLVMRNRSPLSIKTPMLIYNLVIVYTNAYVSAKMFLFCYKYFEFRCNIQEHSQWKVFFQDVYFPSWIYHVSKYVDLLDTVMFVLRKKDSQVTFLHVFHHSVAILMTYFAVVWMVYGYYLFYAMGLNSFVHVFTYSYYTLAALGVDVWWKKYLTMMQILQFWLIMGYLAYALLSGCETLTPAQIISVSFVAVLCILFLHYYVVQFSKKNKSKKA